MDGRFLRRLEDGVIDTSGQEKTCDELGVVVRSDWLLHRLCNGRFIILEIGYRGKLKVVKR